MAIYALSKLLPRILPGSFFSINPSGSYLPDLLTPTGSEGQEKKVRNRLEQVSLPTSIIQIVYNFAPNVDINTLKYIL